MSSFLNKKKLTKNCEKLMTRATTTLTERSKRIKSSHHLNNYKNEFSS